MREIKFRAWETRKKEMFMVNKMTFRTCYDVFRVFGNNHRKDEFHIVNPDDCILMQFTGLKDKNGKEIYEGDILKSYLTNWVGIAYYDTCLGGWYITKHYKRDNNLHEHTLQECKEKEFEIIGNIWEGSELLNENA